MAYHINVFVDEYADMVLRSRSVIQGINESAYQKKIQVRMFFSIDDLIKTLEKESRRFVIVISESKINSEKWLTVLNRYGIHPVFINQQFSDTSYLFSSVMPNLYASFYRLVKAILKECAEASAFIGFNKDSIPDKFRLDGFKKAIKEGGVKEYIIANDGDVDKCISNTISELPKFKNIICTNDAVAVLLMQKMKETGVNLAEYNITGYANMKIGEYFRPSLTTIGGDYYNAGIIAVEVFVFLLKRKQVYNLCANMKSEIIYRESTHYKTKTTASDRNKLKNLEETANGMVNFYGDEPIEKMGTVESMLVKCDNKDFGILRDILANKTYEEIAENQELAVNTVKYRLNKIEKHLKVRSRKEICACLNTYDLNI